MIYRGKERVMANKKNLPYIPLYTGDWEKDCNVLSLEAEAAWLRVVFKMFNNGKQSSYKISTKALQNLWRVDHLKAVCIIEELKDSEICGINAEENHIIFTSRRFEKENLVSEARRKAVASRTDRTKLLQKGYKTVTNHLQNAEIENEDNITINTDSIIISNSIKKEKEKEKEKTWRTDFQIYLLGLDMVYQELISDFNFITEQEELNPGVDIVLSLKKAYTNFWGKEAGWAHKKKQRSKTLDWKSTLTNAISMNKVYKEKTQQRKGTSVAQMQQMINEHNSSLTIQEWNQLR